MPSSRADEGTHEALPRWKRLEIVEAAVTLREGAVEQTTRTLHGWQLVWTPRRGGAARAGDVQFTSLDGGRPIHSIVGLRRQLGLVAEAHEEREHGQRERQPQRAQPQRSRAAVSLGGAVSCYGPAAIGRRCSVLWAGCTPPTWFAGTIKDFSCALC